MNIKTEDKELNALISLLDEPNSKMFDRIRQKIMIYGTDAVPHLESAWDNSFDTLIQDRVKDLIHSIQLNRLKQDIENWKQNDHHNLFRGFYLASKYQYPDLKEDDLRRKVDVVKNDIWLELNDKLTALEKIKVINHVLFDIHSFKGNKANIDASRNLFLNDLLETKKGNHLSIGILYIILTQSLGIPVFGVNLPQHFVLAYADEVKEEKISSVNENDVLFYINPFNKGAVFTQREIELFVNHLKLKPNRLYFKPCNNITIVKRLFESMIFSFNKLGYIDKVEELKFITGEL